MMMMMVTMTAKSGRRWFRLLVATCFLTLAAITGIIQAQSSDATTALRPTLADVAPARGEPFIEWDTNTLVLIQQQGRYGRMIRLRNGHAPAPASGSGSGQLACGYDYRGKIWVRLSSDEGKTWQPAVQVADWEFGGLTNTELLELQDGTVLCF